MMPLSRRLSWMGLKSWQAGHRTWRRDKRVRPTLTLLEERTLLSTLNLTVTTLADNPVSGQTTLQNAITQANASIGNQVSITFAVDGTIDLTTALPALDNNISIEGPGASNLTVQRDSGAAQFSVFSVDGGETINLSGMTIAGSNNGGITNDGALTVNNCIFTDNSAGPYSGGNGGGGIYNQGTLTVNNSSFTNNSGTNGGGIFNGMTATVTNCAFTGNTAGVGGGILNQGFSDGIPGLLTVNNSTFTGNSAGGGGGGIYSSPGQGGANLTVNNSTFTDNSAIGASGGGIGTGPYGSNLSVIIVNSTFTGNSAGGGGGGISNGGDFLDSDPNLIVVNSTFTDNSAIYGSITGPGGGIENWGTLTLNNTIVAGNTALNGPDIYGYVQPNSANNLIGDGTGMTILTQLAPNNLIGTTANPINPMLGPLANNGGPTQTMDLLPGSPAINAGDNALAVGASGAPLTNDQRGAGYPRIVGGTVDIGAYESPYLSQTINFPTTAEQTYGVASITLTATATSGLPVSYTVISGPATVSGDVLTITGAGTVKVEADQAGNATYDVANPVDDSFTVTTASLTITANDATKVYGAPLPPLTLSYNGFVNGDTPANLTTLPSLTTIATASSPVLSTGYNIKASGASDPNYTISYFDNTLMVTPASLTITASPATKVYGAPLPPLTFSGNFVNNDTAASLTTQPILTTTATASCPVLSGGYVITASGASDPNYNISYVNGTLTVTPAPLTITPNLAVKLYGAALPPLTFSGNFVNGDTAASLTTQPILTTTATASSHVNGSPYPITASGASDPNYTITYQTGLLFVNPAPLLVAVNNANKSYGASLPTFSTTDYGFVNNDTAASLTTQPILTTTATASSHVNGSPYPITASGASDPNYTITYQSGQLFVNPVPLLVAVNNANKSYGASLPTFSTTDYGFVNNDTAASLTTQPILTTTATASSHVIGNPYPITASGASDSDYTITYQPGQLYILPVTLTVTPNPATMGYGGPLPQLTPSYAGLVNGDTVASLAAPAVVTTSATASSNVGDYETIASGASDSDYTFTYVYGTVTVTPASLTVSATNESMTYGGTVPVLGYTYTGLVNKDTSATFTGSLATTATSSSSVGGYPITPGNLAATGNYTINTYDPGTLTVIAAPLYVSATNESMTYGGTVPVLGYTYTGLVNKDTSATFTGSLATTATSSSSVGGYPITPGNLAGTGNYTIGTYDPGTLTVIAAPLTVSAKNESMTYGGTVPTPLTYTYYGLVNNDTNAALSGGLATTATSSSSVGDYAIIEGNLAATGNYTINTFNPGTLTVTPAPLTVSATSESMVYGGTVPTPLTYTYYGLVNNDTNAALSGSLVTTVTSSSNVGGYPITQGTLAATGNYTIGTYDPGTLTVTPAPLTVNATSESMVYGGTVPTMTYTYTGLVNDDASATFSGSLATTATSSSSVGDYAITEGNLAATGNYTINTFNPSTLSIAKANAIVVVTPYSVVYNGAAHTATGIATGINGVSLNGLVVNSTHTNAGTYSDTWTFTDTTGNYYNASGTITDTIAPATANITVVGYTTTYDGMPHGAAGAAIDLNNTVLAGLNLPAHTNSGTYIDTWTFSNPNYNSASGTVIDTITKANANIAVVGYNTFYNAVSHIAIGAVYGVNGVALSGLNLSNTVHTNVGTYTDVWTFTDATGNYNNASGTVVDTITPSKSKMVRETVLVPRTTVLKATVLVPVVKEVKVVERVKVGNKWVKRTVLVPETVLVKKTVLVNETKMTRETEMVKVYYS